MAQAQAERSALSSCDAYFEKINSRKKLPQPLQENLTAAFAKIPVSSFPQVPGGKVIEIQADATIADAVKILSENNILSAPVRNPDAPASLDWRERYLGIIDYSAIILWVLENAELGSSVSSTPSNTATAATLGAGAIGAIGALAVGMTGPAAIAGITAAAVGAAVVGGVAADHEAEKDATPVEYNSEQGRDFYKVILKEEPFKSTIVRSVVKSYRWVPFVPASIDSSMLSVLLLLSKYKLKNVPVIESGKPDIKNYITQSAIIGGLERCNGRDWFDCISARPISDMGLPFMSSDEVISIESDDLVLEAFKRMRDNQIGGLPVVEGPRNKIVGNLSIRDVKHFLLKPGLFFNSRQLTVKDFINTFVSSSDQDYVRLSQPITCAVDSSLASVIQSLATKMVHRIYVVSGDENEVMGVITLRDVISCFIFEPRNYFDSYFGFSVQEMMS